MEQKCGSVGVIELSGGNMADKFRAYRLEVESKERKLKEAEMVIQQLKDEINSSINAEKNLRSQISSAQDRLLCQEKMLKKFLTIAVQQRRSEKMSQIIEKTLEKLEEELNQTREKSQEVFQYASKELDLLKKITNLQSALKEKDCETDLKKMKIQTLTKEKEKMENEFQQKIKELEKELEKSVKKEAEVLTLNRETLLFYKAQIEEYEQKIERYERERKSFLEDFEPVTEPKTTSENFTLADSTVADARFSTPMKRRIIPTDELDPQILISSSVPPNMKPTRTKKSYHKLSVKQKPQLEFLTHSQEPTRQVECVKKRRLFSTNCNHYID